MLAEERAWGVGDDAPYERFAGAIDRLRADVRRFVAERVESGAAVAAYGAAAKGVVLANACGLDSTLIRFVVDRSVEKQGRLIPGVRIPVLPPDALLREQPDYCVLFAWNLAAEIVAQQPLYTERGGRFVVPHPEPHVLER
jgi:hypothetical protein